MDSMLDYLDMLEDLIEGGKAMPFSSKVSLDKDQIFDLLADMRLNLPNEIRQAQKIIDDHDRIINDSKSKATAIIREAEERAQEMVYEHEIYKRAEEEARDLIEETRRSVREMRSSTMEYADEILSGTEEHIREAMANMNLLNRAIEDSLGQTIELLYNNRQELRGAGSHTGSHRIVEG